MTREKMRGEKSWEVIAAEAAGLVSTGKPSIDEKLSTPPSFGMSRPQMPVLQPSSTATSQSPVVSSTLDTNSKMLAHLKGSDI